MTNNEIKRLEELQNIRSYKRTKEENKEYNKLIDKQRNEQCDARFEVGQFYVEEYCACSLYNAWECVERKGQFVTLKNNNETIKKKILFCDSYLHEDGTYHVCESIHTICSIVKASKQFISEEEHKEMIQHLYFA